MKTSKFITALSLIGLINSAAYAENQAEEIVNKSVALQNAAFTEERLDDRWRKVLEKSGWADGVHEGGVLLIPARNIIVSSADEFTRVPAGQPGWIESRVVAFERAELEAKAKIIRYLSETTDTSRSIEMFENAGWSDGTIAEIRDVGEVTATLEKIGKKTLAVSEVLLDKTLRKLDPDYDPTKYENLTPEQLQLVVEDTFKRRISSLAFRSLIGVTPFYSTEGSQGGQHHVLVGVIWSPKLNSVALSLGNDVYNLPPVQPNGPIEKSIPSEPDILIGTAGTRIVVDEQGHYNVVSYAQAQPRRAAETRQQSAIQTAKDVAAGRARAQIVNFIKESLSSQTSETASELSREYSDLSVGTESVRTYQEKIAGSRVKVELRGLRTLKEWDYPHPVTGETVTGVILAWSPSSARMAADTEQVMKDQSRQISSDAKPVPEPKRSDAILESMPVETSQY